jgi:hypothetical protein
MYKKKISYEQEENSDSTRKFIQNLLSCHNKKNDTTAQLYRTLSMYVTPKTISCQNQKNNTTPQLYGTLST